MDSPFLAITLLLLYYTLGAPVLGKEYFPKECAPSSCSKDGPVVRFPFRLDSHAQYCGHGDLVLACSDKNTVLRLPSGEYNVTSINYKKAYLTITRYSWTPCPWLHMAEPNVTGSPFSNFYAPYVSWFNCTTMVPITSENVLLAGPISCLGSEGHFIYVAYWIFEVDLLPWTCTKIKNGSILRSPYVSDREYFPEMKLRDQVRATNAKPLVGLYWQDDLINCTICEKRGRSCAFNIQLKKSFCVSKDSHVALIAVISVGALCILSGGILYLYISRESAKKRYTRLKIERFLKNYKVLNPTRYTYDDLKKMTNGFKKKRGNGSFGTVYEGKLPSGIPVAVKMLDRSSGDVNIFINEVAIIGRIYHVNVVRLLGFCSEGEKRALIYEFMENGSLDKYIFSKQWRNNRKLSSEEMLTIILGIAEGIEYLHQGCDQRILHFDIKPHNILLDHNFVPKISDFGLSKLCPKDQSYVTISAARGTMGYLAPEMYSRNFGPVSYKSDVYSFGMLILEMVNGKNSIHPVQGGQSEEYFHERIYDQLTQGENLSSNLDLECGEKIIQKLVIIALWCIQWSPKDRPSMTRVVQMLGEKVQNLQIPPKPVVSPSNQGAKF
ncbi:Protein kinase family protein [Rhynchospora pubera]|uniref:non-specific serine/threonine protein kinase n=2 Tax=Rhynchospora pubera TaxID=906938 RepID=A0AAV8CDW7_9POAL|nr:Protein kinase family protein [Rhynchospora pubera]